MRQILKERLVIFVTIFLAAAITYALLQGLEFATAIVPVLVDALKDTTGAALDLGGA